MTCPAKDANISVVNGPDRSQPDASTGAFQAEGTSEPIGGSPFPPIADFAFLSDCESNCLIAPSGAVEWMCVPRPDSPSIFAAVLDRGAGNFRLGPYDEMVPAARRYLPGSLMTETTWQTRTGWLIVRDALCMGPWHNLTERSKTHRRSPTDYDAEHCLLRTVKCVSGTVELAMTCDPMFDYGRVEPTWSYEGDGYGQLVAGAEGVDLKLRISTDLRPGIERRGIKARTRMVEGDCHFVALSWSPLPPPIEFADATDRMSRTSEHWRQWITQGEFPDHRWRSYLQRSALTLKGLTYAPTGALLAAATTSLPETPHGERNWDYRYAWVRDSTFALWGLYTLGFDREADDFFFFIADACREGQALQVMYAVGGERDLTEESLPHLSGYEGAFPVRVGNGAFSQQQHDVWGAVLDSVLLHARSRSRLQESMWPILKQQVECAAEHWEEPDRGIWEVRGDPQHFTASKFMCWVALDRGARLARMYEQPAYAEKWQALADQIHADICANGVDERGVFVQRYGAKSLDASLLLLPLLRFLPPEDPRIRATVLAIADELTSDGLVLRYRTDETNDGLHGVEGTFTICSFWLVSALIEIGEIERGRRLCERLLSLASPLELYAEELDPHSGRHLGNFPQAFTHLALVNAVMHVIRAEEAQAQMATNVHGTPVDISGPNDDGHPSADEPIALR
jgi:GH15 family glucan-1,4-alpha-glucosidase